MLEQIVSGLAVLAIAGVFGIAVKVTPPAVRRVRKRLAGRQIVMTGEVYTRLMDGWGEANLAHLIHDPEFRLEQSRLFVKVETPDEQRVWSISVPLKYKMSDLALAARNYFKLQPAFFQLINKARPHQHCSPDDAVETAAQAGDRLKLVASKAVWGWGGMKKRGRLRRLADKVLGVKVIRRLGPGNG